MPCSVHTVQIAIKPMITIIQGPMALFRQFVKRVRNTKLLRSAWKVKSTEIRNGKGSTEPLPLDTPTRWNSTWAFSVSCERDHEVLKHVNEVAPEKDGAATLNDIEDGHWSIMKACNMFLEKPAMVRISITLSLFPTMLILWYM